MESENPVHANASTFSSTALPSDQLLQMRASRIRPPSRIESPTKALIEMNDFDSNARSKPSKLPAPQVVNTLKRSNTAAFEPESKQRKTLVERAGESSKSAAATPVPRPAVKGTSLQATSMRPPPTMSRNASVSSSTTGRSTSHSRTASNSSFASSVGAGTRQASSTYGRPKTSLAFSRSQIGRPTYTRPGTSLASFNTEEEDEEEHQSPTSAKRKAWNTEARLGDMEVKFEALKAQISDTHGVRDTVEETLTECKIKIAELEALRTQLTTSNVTLQAELDVSRLRATTLTTALDDERRARNDYEDDMRRRHRNECEDFQKKLTDEKDRLIKEHHDKLREFERRKNSEQEEERSALFRELQQAKSQIAAGNESTEAEKQRKDREVERLRSELEDLRGVLEREQALKRNLQDNMVESSTTIATLENNVRSLRAQIDFLESDSMSQSQRFEDMEARLQAALTSAKESKEKLMKEESIRRSLFNQVQELKGNIRVMCRVRPTFSQEGPDDVASISFPDSHKESKELEVLGPAEKSSLGKETRRLNAFSFDRVFGQSSQNEEIFEEISQLVQSALDGYNVCIFCYGQTGAGKTFTMSSADGMIPRAVKQIYETATKLQEKNWRYKMEGNFIEVYNEDLHDLLGNPKEFDKKKHEIRHDTQRKQTTVTELTMVELDSPDRVEMILSKAMANRSVAATLSNERSSRSHSVFILKLLGTNTTTGETSEGTLNLVDLAGSERLKQSGAEGARMKETQNINKSLSCLGDVIGALGNGKEGSHIPYRNSKLTYLLQYSLGGNSKTLMFVMISPLQAHLNETLTSLKFATKVHNTHIGTAKKSTRIRERCSES